MKLLLCLLLFPVVVYCQPEKAKRYHITRFEMKVAAHGGGITDWKYSEKMNDGVDQNITLNVSKKTIVWDYKLEGEQRVFNTYPMLSFAEDTTYMDFGMYALIMKIKEEKGKVRSYKIVFSDWFTEDAILITSIKGNISRYYLKEF